MNQHEAIVSAIHEIVDAFGGVATILPSTIAQRLSDKYQATAADPHVQYASREHFKQMARQVLAGRYGHESDETEAHQGELFSGRLQSRYPTPRTKGSEPAYKLREALTPDERAWNVATLRRSANTRLAHADALEAEGLESQAA